jgi:hypothetical protein
MVICFAVSAVPFEFKVGTGMSPNFRVTSPLQDLSGR